MSTRRALDVIQVNRPCSKAWDEMPGDQQRRFCAHCQKHVHDLSSMSIDEAERLVCASAGNLCVRFARDPETGQVITLDYRPKPTTSRRRALLTIASILSALGFTGAWAAAKLLRKPAPRPTVVVGDLVPFSPPANTQQAGTK